MRKLILSLILSLSALPAFADTTYLVFPQGQTRTTQSYTGANPPDNAYVWTQTTSQDPQDYLLSGGAVIFSPIPAVPYTGPALPQVGAFILAINNDPLVTGNPALMFQLAANLLPLMQSDLQVNPAYLQPHWTAAKAAFGATWLTAPVQAMLLGYAATYHIPIS